ncbi:PH domain-containing protein [Simonsiella muelleri]|jgi:hypothetical protein|uniref:Bacterial Pleckstrin homology domain-containing protein n=2 Tax=Simonsiella TaxID=71 RepID=V9H9A9_9NEIS|nr:PH domain-containing protein [Simonsiella muelleri]AUX61924.1 hypothetical protein BWP33_08980 [Simonsiella muelleri ATCC 29453]EFG31590.1 hypothetical protein HMPREF9021_00866 [Simonsiella muelleri ATCC 29453]UBQ54012.1 PH domain-containing protein [Simonsiella muelleri]
MFKNLAADALGLSDIGKIIPPDQFHQTDIDDYIFHEDNEKIYFVIKSKSDEYCFTNLAFIHLDGQSAVSKKRTLKRYPYRYYTISHVFIETAGTIDLDVELKFTLNKTELFSIDIDKKEIESVRDIYKALIAISEQCQTIKNHEWVLEKSFTSAVGMIDLKTLPEKAVMALPKLLNHTVSQLEDAYNQRLQDIRQYDFGAIFEHYLNH